MDLELTGLRGGELSPSPGSLVPNEAPTNPISRREPPSETPETASRLIHHIPVEILEHILELALRPLDPETYYRDLYKMALVCQTWSGVIRNSPGLWSIVEGRGLTSVSLSTILSRSKAHPLIIRNYTVGQPPNDVALFEHVGRWLDVSIHSLSAAVLPGLCPEPAPLLQKAAFFSALPTRQSLPNLFGGQAPNLRYLSFYHCWLPFSSPLYQRLHVLSLAEVSLEGISLQHFVRFLAGCTKLVSLSLENVIIVDQSINEDEEVVLSSLKTLRTKFIVSAEALAFVNAIQLPQCTTMKHHYLAWPGPLTVPLSSSVPRAVRTFKEMVASATYITVTIQCTFNRAILKISCTMDGRKTLDLRVGEVQNAVNALTDLAADWGFNAVTAPITVHLSYPEEILPDLVGLLTMLHNFQSITKLILKQSCLSALIFTLTALTDPYVVENQFRWICPNLQDLLFLDCEECTLASEEVLHMLKHRYGDEYDIPGGFDPTLEGEPILHRPTGLKNLVLQGAEHDEAIVEAVGPQAGVVWDSDEFSLPAGVGIPGSDSELDAASDSEWDDE